MCIRDSLMEDKPMAELSHTLGTIRTDAPIDTAEGSYAVGEGNKAAAVRLLQELEIHSLIPRFGLDGVAPVSYTHLDVYKRQALPQPGLLPVGHGGKGHRTGVRLHQPVQFPAGGASAKD